MRIEFPGFFDLLVNGFAGLDFNKPGCTPDQLKHATDAPGATGVTRFLLALIISSLERFSICARSILRFSDNAIAGIHMDGVHIYVGGDIRCAIPFQETLIDGLSNAGAYLIEE